jgi:hypothetical protein
MFYLFRLLFLSINVDQETVLNWFGIEDPTALEAPQALKNSSDSTSTIESSIDLSFDRVCLIVQGLWDKIQDGLTLGDIETIQFFLLFVWFIILAMRYNLKTSFYITCIGIFAGYLWY